MGLAVGPAIPGMKVVVVMIILWMNFMAYLTSQVSQCTKDAMALYPNWLWLLFLPLFVCRFAVEFYSLKLCAIPYVQIVGSFKIFGKSVGFWAWFTFAFLGSTLNMLDFVTDSFFLGSTLKTDHCGDVQISNIWHFMLTKSFVWFLADQSISSVVLAFWALSFVQMVWPLLVSWPRRGESVDYKVGSKSPDGTRRYHLQFYNIFGVHYNLGNTIYMLAEAGGMTLLQSHNPWYPRLKVDKLQDEDDLRGTNKNYGRILSILRGELDRGVMKYAFNALLESSLQVNLQITLYALSRASQGVTKVFQYQQILSIVIGLTLSLTRASLVHELIAFRRQVLGRQDVRPDQRIGGGVAGTESVDAEPILGNEIIENPIAVGSTSIVPFEEAKSDGSGGWTVEDEIYACNVRTWSIVIMSTLYFLLMLYAVVKLFMAFWCKDAVWNITGCVDLGPLGTLGT